MAGLLAWAADVVGGANQGVACADDPAAAFTPEQRRYAAELDERSAALRLSIQELRARIPPADIAKSLPHLHAHSVASNAALALQLNAHSTTRQQAQIREDTLQEDNLAFENAIQTCQKKIQEKLEEAHLLQSKLKEMDVIQRELEEEMESLRLSCDREHPIAMSDNSKSSRDISDLKEPSNGVLLKQLDEKKKELASIEELIQNLENSWAQVNQEFIKKPTPAQREKILDKQLHSLVEQLTAKHAQAEGFQLDIRNKQLELEKLNALSKRLGSGTPDTSATRNRSMRTGLFSADNGVEVSHRYAAGGKLQSIPKSVFLRSTFVLYILALHLLVFIKISF